MPSVDLLQAAEVSEKLTDGGIAIMCNKYIQKWHLSEGEGFAHCCLR
jgi:hypothetical protein